MKILCWKDWLNYFLLVLLFLSPSVYASTTGNLPCNTVVDTFKADFIALVFSAAVILMMASCLMLAFSEWGDGIKRLVGMLFFLALSLAAPTGVVLLFGTGAVF